ncbi:hypothetical protein FRC04_010653, partial [Tulasnella sp. 424]
MEEMLGGQKDKTGIKRGPYKVGGLSKRTIRQKKAAFQKEVQMMGLPEEVAEQQLKSLDRLGKSSQANLRQSSLYTFFSPRTAKQPAKRMRPISPSGNEDSFNQLGNLSTYLLVQESTVPRAWSSEVAGPSTKRVRLEECPDLTGDKEEQPNSAGPVRFPQAPSPPELPTQRESDSPASRSTSLPPNSDSLDNESIVIDMGRVLEGGEKASEDAEEWVDVLGEEVNRSELTFEQFETLALEGLASARKRKVYAEELLFACLADFYRWSKRQKRMSASRRVARNHRRGEAFAKALRTQARYFEQTGSLKPSARGKRGGARSLLDDEEMCMGLQRWLRTLEPGKVNPAVLKQHVNENILPTLSTPAGAR